MKRTILILILLTALVLTGCGNNGTEIIVYSREDGSGTRRSFVELFETELNLDDGTRKDLTTKEAGITNNTEVMLTSVSKNKNAIGYVSLGSVNDTIKILQIDGAEATPENVKSGAYKVTRPFTIATKQYKSELANDFIEFILSKEGQEVVAHEYITVDDYAEAYAGNKPSGKIVIGGSSSVAPIMEKLKEAYSMINPAASIELQISDSTSGISGVVSGNFDIAMVSRTLKASEKENLTATAIAIDGIAVIVNKQNPNDSLTHEQVKSIYKGETINWSDIQYGAN